MKPVRIILFIVLALALGIAIGVWRIAQVEKSAAFVRYGSWTGTHRLALNQDDLLTTQVTVFALFALPSSEAVYLFATKDENGVKLNGSGQYIIEGNINNIKARYWSITAYGKDLYLIPNQKNCYSFNNNNVQTDSAGNFKITVAENFAGANHLPVQLGKPFRLVLRLYEGDKDFLANLEKAQLPVIAKVTEL